MSTIEIHTKLIQHVHSDVAAFLFAYLALCSGIGRIAQLINGDAPWTALYQSTKYSGVEL